MFEFVDSPHFAASSWGLSRNHPGTASARDSSASCDTLPARSSGSSCLNARVASSAPRGYLFGSRIALEHRASLRRCAERGKVRPRLAETDVVRSARCVRPSVAAVVVRAVVLPAAHSASLVVGHVQQCETAAALARMTRGLGSSRMSSRTRPSPTPACSGGRRRGPSRRLASRPTSEPWYRRVRTQSSRIARRSTARRVGVHHRARTVWID